MLTIVRAFILRVSAGTSQLGRVSHLTIKHTLDKSLIKVFKLVIANKLDPLSKRHLIEHLVQESTVEEVLPVRVDSCGDRVTTDQPIPVLKVIRHHYDITSL